jgi:hypothetical protein
MAVATGAVKAQAKRPVHPDGFQRPAMSGDDPLPGRHSLNS